MAGAMRSAAVTPVRGGSDRTVNLRVEFGCCAEQGPRPRAALIWGRPADRWRKTDTPGAAGAPAPPPPFGHDQGVAESVLLVDDNARFRTRAKRLLEANGFAVVAEAADGASALEAARGHRPAVVLLDVQLPDMSGLEVAERLCREPGAPA